MDLAALLGEQAQFSGRQAVIAGSRRVQPLVQVLQVSGVDGHGLVISVTDHFAVAYGGGPSRSAVVAALKDDRKLDGSGLRRASEMVLYRWGFLSMFSSQGRAAPSPEKKAGIHEYLSVYSHRVMPTHLETARQALTTLRAFQVGPHVGWEGVLDVQVALESDAVQRDTPGQQGFRQVVHDVGFRVQADHVDVKVNQAEPGRTARRGCLFNLRLSSGNRGAVPPSCGACRGRQRRLIPVP